MRPDAVPPPSSSDPQIAHVRGVTLALEGVRDCHVALRRRADGNLECVVYLVAAPGVAPEHELRARVAAALPAGVSLALSSVSCVPRTEDGEVDEEALSRLPVITPELARTLEAALTADPAVAACAVSLVDAPRASSHLHLADLLPRRDDRLAPPSLPVPPASAPAGAAASRRRPALSDGGPLTSHGDRRARLPELLVEAARRGGARRIVFTRGRGEPLIWRHADLLAEAERIGGGLAALGLPPRSRVILQLERNEDILAALWGCILTGFVPLVMEVPSRPDRAERAFDHLCLLGELLDGPLILTTLDLRERAAQVAHHAPGVRLACVEELRAGERRPADLDGDPDDVAFLCSSSGSTGTPKCVQFTHRCAIGRADGVNAFNDHGEQDVLLNWLPFDHIGSITEHIRGVRSRCDLVYTTKDEVLADPLHFLDLVDRHRVTHTWGPNFVYGLIAGALERCGPERRWDLSCVRFMVSGGEAASRDVMRGFLAAAARHGFPSTGFRPSFGMAEVSSGITYHVPSPDAPLGFVWLARAGAYGEPIEEVTEDTPGAVPYAGLGRPIPGCELRIVDRDGELAPEGTVGRLQVRGAPVARGYLKNEAMNRAVFLESGWLETEDLGFLLDGRLHLTGRTKEMLIINGVNYYSREIEDIVEAQDGVEASFTAACAVKTPTSSTEELAVFLSTDRVDGALRDLLRRVREAVVRRAHVNPTYIVPVPRDELPKTAIGKIQRLTLARRFEAGRYADTLRELDVLLGNHHTLPDWFLTGAWRPARLPEPLARPGAAVLLLADPSPLRDAILERLDALGVAVFTASRGPGFARVDRQFTVGPGLRDDLARCLAALADVRLADVVDLWSHAPDEPDDGRATRILALLQALAGVTTPARPLRLTSFDHQSRAVAPDDGVAPLRAACLGLLRTASHELPGLTVTHVDLPLDEGAPELVLHELLAQAREPEVAYRRGVRRVHRWARPAWGDAAALREPFVEGGVYVLVGGLGGIGTHLASYLLQRHQARLVLVGRRAASEAVEARLAELRGLGGEVRYVAADVAEPAQIARVTAALAGWNSSPDGVIQLASSFHERLLVDETADSLGRSLAPVLRGASALEEQFGGTDATAFVFFASAAAHVGAFGCAAYCAAHSYVLAHAARMRRRGARVYTLAWTQWRDTGLNAGKAQQDLVRSQRGYMTIDPPRGVTSCAVALAHEPCDLTIGLDPGDPQIEATLAGPPRPLRRLRADVELRPEARAPAPRVVDPFGRAVPCDLVVVERLPRTSDGAVDRDALLALGRPGERPGAHPRNPTEQALLAIWQGVLKLKIGIHDNFFEMGGDSIKAVMVMNQLQERLQGIFHPVSIFDAPTVAALAEYLERNYPAVFSKLGAPEATDAPRVTPALIEHMRGYLAGKLVGRDPTTDHEGPRNPRAVFILSPARSGSTLLRVILAGNPRLFSPPELYMLGFRALAERRREFSGRLEFLREGLIRAFMAIHGETLEAAEQRMAELEAADLPIKRVYSRLQAWLGDRLLVDKTPPYAFNPEVLRRMEAEFDAPLYIHLKRHPAAMIGSFEEARVDLAVAVHGDEDASTRLDARQRGELWWLISHQNIREFLATIPAERQYALSFESLVRDPGPQVDALCRFLGVPFHPAMLEPQRDPRARMTDGAHHFSRLSGDPKFHAHQGITAEAADRWRQTAQPPALAEETWQLAAALGYARPGEPRSPYAAPPIEPDPQAAHLPFPLTDVQQAYWAGRGDGYELGGRSVHSYNEVDGVGLDLERLERALARVVARHAMLRAVVTADGTQRILPDVPAYRIAADDLRGCAPAELAARLAATRARMSDQVLPCETWPTFEVRASLLPGGRHRIHLCFDALFFDARSKYILFHDLRRFYQDPGHEPAPLALSFRDFVLRERQLRDSELHAEARAYWHAELDDLPPAPELPLAVQPAALRRPTFFQLHRTFPQATWARLKRAAARAAITPSGLLLAAFADALRPWSRGERFTLNVTTYRRLPLHPQVGDVIGDFTSMVLLAVDAPGAAGFAERAQALQKRLLTHLGHAAFSGVETLRELARRRGGRAGALAPVVFTSVLGDELHDPDEAPLDWLGEVVHNLAQTPQIWFDHVALEEGGRLLCRWNIVEGLFPAGVPEAMFAAYVDRLARLADDEDAIREPWPETARRSLPAPQLARRRAYNDTAAPLPAGLLHDGFLAQAHRQPLRPAVIAADRTLDYQTLRRLAVGLAHRLRRAGAARGRLVAVAMEKGWEQVVATLAVLLAGAAYLPIDPSLPEERFSELLARGEARVLVTQPHVRPLLPSLSGCELVCVADDELTHEPDAPPTCGATPDDLAYVLFTSGSTGTPKGVMIDHRGALNTVVDINRRFAVGPDDRVLALSSLSFDLSVHDIFGVLAAGGAVVVPRPSELREPRRWAELVGQHRVTLWNTVPALMSVLLDVVADDRARDLAPLRLVLLSGDWIPTTLPDRLRHLGHRPTIVSLGGATEASIWSILHPIDAVDPAWTSIPYGRPMTNQTVHVLDPAMEARPEWVPGVLYIGGVGVARGYWRDPERSAAGFVVHPRTGERLYRTGDLGRFVPAPDGAPTIEFLGREDLQVKVQGFRVELGEIDAALAQHPDVVSAVVEARGPRHGEKQLVAYVVLARDVPDVAERLRQHLRRKLPSYMVPAQVVVLPELPLTANGKLDRKALPDPQSAAPARAASGSPAGAVDDVARIVALVAATLERVTVAADDNLFDLGATSIDLMRIVNQIERRLGARLPIDELFAAPSAAGIAAALRLRRDDERRVDPALSGLAPDILARHPFLGDPDERRRFKATRDEPRPPGRPAVALPPGRSPELAALRRSRRSHRQLTAAPLPVTALAELLAGLQAFEEDGRSRRAYGSAGGLYPVETYLYVKPDRVDGLPGGAYRYHETRHQLVRLPGAAALDERTFNAHINRPLWRRAAFAVFLVADLAAIVPMYRERSVHFAILEAGLMTQLLETLAPGAGLGLCQIGEPDLKPVGELLQLDDDHALVHALVGGAPDRDATDDDASPPDDTVQEEF